MTDPDQVLTPGVKRLHQNREMLDELARDGRIDASTSETMKACIDDHIQLLKLQAKRRQDRKAYKKQQTERALANWREAWGSKN